MNYLSFGGLIVGITSLFASLFILFHTKSAKKKLIFRWSFFSLTVGLWGVGLYFLFNATTIETALYWGRLLNYPPIFIPVSFFNFTCVLLKIVDKKKKELIIYYIITFSIFVSSILFPDIFIPSVKSIKFLFLNFYYPQAGFIFHLLTAQFAYLVSYGMLLVFKAENDDKYLLEERNQMKYLKWGCLVGFIGGSMTFYPIYGLDVPPIGIYLTPVYIFTVAYAIINYNLLDIEFVAKKIISWSITFLLVFGIEVAIYLFVVSIHLHIALIYILIFFNLIVAYFAIRFIINIFNPAFLKDFENRIKNLSNMGTKKGVFNNLKDFADHLTQDVANVMNSKNVMLFLFNSENGLFEIVAQSSLKVEMTNEDIKNFACQIDQYLNQNKEALIKSTLKLHHKELKDLLDKMQIVAIFPFFIDNTLMGFMTLGDCEKNYLYHKKEIEQLGYLLKLKEHIFANTYFLNLQKTIADITQQIIDIDEPSEFTHYLTSKITRQFNIENSAFYVFDKEKKAFVCRQQIGYGEDSLPDIAETSSLLKVLNKSRTLITILDLPTQNSKIKIDLLDDIISLLENKLKTFVVAPLISTSGIIGIMFFGYKKMQSDYYAYDLDFIKNIATISSIKLLGFIIKEEAEIDTLTKALNRKSLSVRLEKVIKATKQTNKVILFIFFDLDHFKQINDTKTHDFGDKVLAELANKIKTGSRPEDMLFRLGGEEFVFVVGPIDEADVETIKKKFLDIIYKDLKTGKYTKDLTLSMSDVLFKANREISNTINNIKNIQKIVFKQGDDAVYKVKKAGRNNIENGGIVEDNTIGEKYQMTIQVISDEDKYNEELGQYFQNAGIDVKYSNFDDAVKIFEKERPDNFLCIYYEKKKLDSVREILTEIKNRSMSSEIGVAVKTDTMKKDLKDFTNLMFFNITEQKLIDNWAKALAKDLD